MLFFIHALTGGGAERVMATLMNAFVNQGHTVRVVYTTGLESPVYKLDPRIEQVYLAKNGPKVKKSIVNKIHRRLVYYPAIRREAKRFAPDFAISFIKTHNNDILFALLGTGIPVIVGDHTNISRKYKKKTLLLSKLLYPTAAGITMLTKCDYDVWKTKYEQSFYIPNPCDFGPQAVARQRQKTLLAVGRVFQWHIKGFDNLFKAWNRIKDKFPDWKCQIAGGYDEKSMASLRSAVTEQEFNSVEFLGFRSDIKDLMMQSEVFCLSSRFEGMPMALLEAMNAGCACVAFDCVTGPSEMIEDGVTGLLVKNQDVNDLAEKLEQIITYENLRERFHKNASKSVTRFSTANIIGLWNDMFNKIKSNKCELTH